MNGLSLNYTVSISIFQPAYHLFNGMKLMHKRSCYPTCGNMWPNVGPKPNHTQPNTTSGLAHHLLMLLLPLKNSLAVKKDAALCKMARMKKVAKYR